MQASFARWAVVTFCTLGSLGCQSSKPGWWPGQKSVPYSQSSSTPPAAVQQQQQQQQQYPTPANGYIDQANAGQGGAANAYQQAGGYPIGANPQAGYGNGAGGANPYDQAYGQQQQPTAGAYPENYPNTANPYAQPSAMGGYTDPQAAGGYPGSQGYGQAGGNPYGQNGAAPGYDPVRTADARQAAGGGYGANSPYDPNTYGGGSGGYPPQDQYNSQTPSAPAGGYPQTQSPADQGYPNTNGYQSGGASTGYQPGATGYNPPGTTQYQSPTGPYADQTAAAQTDPHYRPGSTSDYAPTAGATAGAASTAATGYGQPATTGTAPGGYSNNSPYIPNTGGGGASPASPAVDRYGRPVQTAGGYGNSGTIQQ